MKKHLNLIVFCVFVIAIAVMHSCRKETVGNVNTPIPLPPIIFGDMIVTSYTEEFQDISSLIPLGRQIGNYSEGDEVGYS